METKYKWQTVPMIDYKQTLTVIVRFAEQYKNDLKEFKHWSLRRFYDFVHALPYIRDPKDDERVQRPLFTKRLTWGLRAGETRDCDDKTLLLAAFCELQSIPWRMIVSAEMIDQDDDPVWSHIYIEAKLSGSSFWTILDATIPGAGGWALLAQTEAARRVHVKEKVTKTGT